MISSLHLQNFKCFEDQKFNFASLTLLSGLNGMGKSTVFQAMLLLRQSYLQGLLSKSKLALNGDFVQLGTGIDTLFEDAKDEIIRFKLELDDETSCEWKFEYNPDADILKCLEINSVKKIEDSSLFNEKFQYLNAERIGPRNYFQFSESRVGLERQLGTKGEYTAHFLSKFGNEEIQFKEMAFTGSENYQLLSQVENWLGEISPGTRLTLTPFPNMDLVNLEYSFKLRNKISNKFRSTNVGFGITYVLPIITAILSSVKGTLLLIENPEAHLHPRGQVKIGELIALATSCGVQILVETHSDHILNGIRMSVNDGIAKPEDISLQFFDEKNINDGQANISTPIIDKYGRINEWPNGFFDEWDKSLESLTKPNLR